MLFILRILNMHAALCMIQRERFAKRLKSSAYLDYKPFAADYRIAHLCTGSRTLANNVPLHSLVTAHLVLGFFLISSR